MSKKPKINNLFPASLFNFSKDSKDEKFTRAQCRVFYEGETVDHRFFSHEMSQNLVKTLPYTPIVSYYDSKKKDFVGHSTEQAIYGIVDPNSDIKFEKNPDNPNQTDCICGVVLYTERPDQVGEIAKKIVGHPQSLEMDPKTMKYKYNYDAQGHFKNLEFTAGQFLGLSVLGKDQTPAFTGAGFFSSDSQFESKMNLLKDYCKNTTNEESKMKDLLKFMELT